MERDIMNYVEKRLAPPPAKDGGSLLSQLDPQSLLLNLPVYINPGKCIACGICAEVCPFGLPERTVDNKYQIYNVERCTECSACQRNCPAGAVVMHEIEGCGCLWDAAQRSKDGQGKCESNCCK